MNKAEAIWLSILLSQAAAVAVADTLKLVAEAAVLVAYLQEVTLMFKA